ncbi:hypothetical protein HXX76_006557 [Chlamydomonas incerta]|uniref:Uncharacterized protein n=1 Tax=Chlamydomonas incerta TaxID=51695 RepID=A0A835T2P4_CHLIN|nr:hypothetical protein HXX76_006556 [Chlamydomonas incerta]KAG2436246.1 hypothetical protein HXX76_006557 [Chlamydomonas incerta]|eukprot:KAG2436245.1 hypothetical protein HXX76_006556 [Chlamydomonas incerta]
MSAEDTGAWGGAEPKPEPALSVQAGATWTASIHPRSIPGALRAQQDAISKIQRTLRQELGKLQAEEAILKLMIKRERKRLLRQAQRRQEAQAARRDRGALPSQVLEGQRQERQEQ